VYNTSGAGVQNSPKIYPIFWGSNWGTAPGAELRAELLAFYQGLSGSAYQGILTQYFDAGGNISASVAVASPYVDATAATQVNRTKISEEISKAITVNKWPSEFDGQYEVFTSPGSTFEASFAEGGSGFCAFHSHTAGGISYSFVPYQGDPPFGTKYNCQYFVEGNAAFSTVASAAHEYAEAVTDPVPGEEATRTWQGNGYAKPEIADLCEGDGTFRLPNGSWAQDLFDNSAYGCSREDLHPAHVYAATEKATNISGTAATLIGLVNSEGLSTKYYAEYGLTKSYGSRSSEATAPAGIGSVGASVSGLAPGTTYHYRLVATNASGTLHGVDRTFETASAPTIQSFEAIVPTASTVLLRTAIKPNGSPTSYRFEYGPTTAYGTRVPVPNGELGGGWELTFGERHVENLEPETVYHFRVVAENAVGVSRSEDRTFVTGAAAAPTVTTGEARAVFEEDELSGTVNPNGLPTSYQFEYGTSTSYGSNVPIPAQGVGSGVETLHVAQQLIPALNPDTTYHYRLVATNAKGTSYGSDREFSTVKRPEVVTEPASETNTLEPRVNAAINPEGFETSYEFEYGPTEAYGSKIPLEPAQLGGYEKFISVSAVLKGLKRGSTFHYRVVATNLLGTRFGADQTFTTLPLCAGGTETCSWAQQTTANPPATSKFSLKDASCASATLCLAPGWDGGTGKSFLDLWNGTEWSLAKGSLSGTEFEGEMTQLSCPTAGLCIGIGSTPSGGLQSWKVVAEGTHWTPLAKAPPTPSGGTQAKLNDVSCSSETACTAVGSYYAESAYKPLVERWNGSEWTVQSAPSPTEGSAEKAMLAVSCSSSTSCMAVGKAKSKPFAERWNGSEWTLGSAMMPAGASEAGLVGVSCPTSTSCMAVGSLTEGTVKSLSERWNGSSWSVQSAPNAPEREATLLNGVSCLSASSCYAVGESWKTVLNPQAKTVAESWNGTAWTLQSTPNPSGSSSSPLVAVSCTSSVACTAIGTATPGSAGEQMGTLAERWNGSSWAQQTTANPPATSKFSLKDASCASATLCLAPGWDGGTGKSFLDLWNGTEWSLAKGSLSGTEFEGEMTQLSCPTAGLCIGIGSTPSGGLQSWKVVAEGTHWTPLAKAPPTPSGGTQAKLNDVSCSSETACTAVGSYYAESAYKPLVERWNGSEWTVQSAPSPTEGSAEKAMLAVSCSSSTSCMAVGKAKSKPFAERWNGSEWTLGSAMMPAGASEAGLVGVSCPTSTSCMAVGSLTEGTVKSLSERWNGSSWSVQSAPNAPEREATLLNGVSCLSASSCYAVGESWKTVLNPQAKTVAESWNGTAWTLQSTPNPSGSSSSPLVAVSCTSSVACTAIGTATPGSAGEQMGTLAERWG
jgi:hypothetical protein